MPSQILEVDRAAARGEIGRGAAHGHALAGQRPRHQAGHVAQMPVAHGQVIAFLDEIDRTVGESDFELQLPVLPGSLVKNRRHAAAAENHRNADPHLPGRFKTARFERGLAGLEFGEHPHAALVERLSVIGQAERAGRAVTEPHAEPRFQPRDGLADGRARQVQAGGRGSKAASLDHRHKLMNAGKAICHRVPIVATEDTVSGKFVGTANLYRPNIVAAVSIEQERTMNQQVRIGTAKRWAMAEFGRQNLTLVDGKVPNPAANEILVKIAAVALNYRDTLLVDDGFGFSLPGGQPLVPGSDAAGVVVATGPDVSRFKAGDRVISTFIPGWIDGLGFGTARHPNDIVLGGSRQGMLAEYVVLDENWAVKSPEHLSDVEASTLPCAGLTAWTALVERGKVQAGQTVVVQGTGGVALFGLQIAAMHGAEVIVVSGDDDKLCAGQGARREARHQPQQGGLGRGGLSAYQ